MSLTIAIENPLEAHHAEAWQALGIHDPTRLSAAHENNLVQELARNGAQQALVYLNSKPVLRFLLHTLRSREGVASLGFFGLDPDAPDVLLQEGFQLALQKIIAPHHRQLVGPMNGSTWFPYRLRVDEHPLQFDWEPRHDSRLENLLQTAGFYSWAHYHSTASSGLKKLLSHAKKDWDRVTGQGFTIRLLTLDDLKAGALFDLHRLSQLGFADNLLFAPLDFEAFARSYVEGKSGKQNVIAMASHADGRPAAFFLTFLEPSYWGEPRPTLVLKTVATHPEFRRLGLTNALLYAIGQNLPDGLSDTYISALVFQGATSESFARHGQTLWEHQYVLLAKDLL